jgi:hypothetical protein
VEDEGKGVVNEKVEVWVLMVVVIVQDGEWVNREETGKGMSEEDGERRERTLWTLGVKVKDYPPSIHPSIKHRVQHPFHFQNRR